MKKSLLVTGITVLCFLLFTKAFTQVSVTATTGTTSGTYTTLGGAFAAINNGTHKGAITITLTASTTETATASLDSSGNPTGSSYTSVTIQPAASTAVTITGTIAGALINLNGADNVKIDGLALPPASAALTISNTNTTSSASTIRFINDAVSDTIKNCTIKGAAASISTGVIVFSTGLVTGNDNNALLSNDIDCTASAGVGIYSSGTTTTPTSENSGNTVNNCWVHDYFNATLTSLIGVYLFGGNTDWTFNANSFYQSAPRTVTTGTVFYGMLVGPSYTSDKHTVTANFFGGSAPGASNTTGNMQLSGSGTAFAGFFGFSIQTGGTGNLVDGNIVRNITLTSSSASSPTNAGFFGFIGGYDGTSTFSNNQVKDISLINNTTGGFISFQGVHVNGRVVTAGTTVLPIFNVQNNTVSNITATSSSNAEFQFHGIKLETSSAASLTGATTIANVTFNASGNNVNSFTVTTTGTSTYLRGIGVVTTNGTSSTAPLQPKATLTNNIVHDLYIGGGLANYGTPTVSGIQVTGAANVTNADVQTISGNTIYNLGATTTADVSNAVAGIIGTSSTYVVEKNRIYGLSNTAAGTAGVPIVSGINLRSMVATSTIKNNFVSLGAGQSTNTNFFGILNNFSSGSPINIYYNTVYLTGIGGAKNSVGFYRGNEAMSAAITTTVDIKDNIFYNFRSGGTGSNYAIGSFGTGAWTSNYNILKSTVSTTVATWNNTSMDLPTYQTSSGQDANSKNITVNFVDPATADLHLSGSSNGDVNLIGTPIAGITTDYDGQTRSSFNPYIGADEASIPLPIQLISFSGAKEGAVNRLSWSTSAEINNKGFELERSADGRNFSSIGFITSKATDGNSNFSLNYDFTDEKPFAAVNYYRLKQTDKDGKVAYSSIVILKGDKNSLQVSAVYPNPAKDQLNLSVMSPVNGKATITVSDATGKVVIQLSKTLITGDNNLNINVGALPTGLYYIRLIAGTASKTTQFIKN